MTDRSALRHCTDWVMTAVMMLLMSYTLTSQSVHEWLGLGAFALFLFHHLLNLGWLRAWNKGRYSGVRTLQTVLVVLLLISVLTQTVSGAAMSRHVLSSLKLPIPISAARLAHLAGAYWSFLLMALHLGFHWGMFLGLARTRLRRGRPLSSGGRTVLRLAAAAAAAAGLACFLRQGIPDYLFLRTQFAFLDYSLSPLAVLFRGAAVLSLWTLAGYLLRKGAQLWDQRKKEGRK